MNFPQINYPLVSIVLGTYNGATFLKEQLESLVNQTYSSIEIIAVDDGSTDDTVSILKEYSVLYKNIKVFVNENNLGFIKNFEKGCSLASGEYIAFCDQDDCWHPEKIEKMVQHIGDHAMIFCNSALCDEALQPTGKNTSDIASYMSYYSCLQKAVFCRINGHAMMFTSSLFRKANIFLTVIPHDWWIAYNATLQGGVKYLNEALVNYRQHSTNVFGVVGSKRRKENKEIQYKIQLAEKEKIRERIKKFYELCPDKLIFEKKVLKELMKSYESFSLRNNFRRCFIFFKHYKLLLASKKRSTIRQYFFCLKMFFIIK